MAPRRRGLGAACHASTTYADSVTSEQELPLGGGWVTAGVVRVGSTVRKPPGPNAPLIRQLLSHLESVGFDAAPRFVGYDEHRRETLEFIEGDVPSDCRSIVWSDEQLAAAAELLRGFHDATAGSGLAGEAEVICHNDFGPWNLIWRGGLPVAIIDFDNVAPGDRLDDLGYAVWKHLNLGLLELPTHEQQRRLKVMVRSYGTEPTDTLLRAISAAQLRMRRLIQSAQPGQGRDCALAQNERERRWLRAYGRLLVS